MLAGWENDQIIQVVDLNALHGTRFADGSAFGEHFDCLLGFSVILHTLVTLNIK